MIRVSSEILVVDDSSAIIYFHARSGEFQQVCISLSAGTKEDGISGKGFAAG